MWSPYIVHNRVNQVTHVIRVKSSWEAKTLISDQNIGDQIINLKITNRTHINNFPWPLLAKNMLAMNFPSDILNWPTYKFSHFEMIRKEEESSAS